MTRIDASISLLDENARMLQMCDMPIGYISSKSKNKRGHTSIYLCSLVIFLEAFSILWMWQRLALHVVEAIGRWVDDSYYDIRSIPIRTKHTIADQNILQR